MHFHCARHEDAEYQSSEFIEQKKDKPAAFVTERWKSDMQGARAQIQQAGWLRLRVAGFKGISPQPVNKFAHTYFKVSEFKSLDSQILIERRPAFRSVPCCLCRSQWIVRLRETRIKSILH